MKFDIKCATLVRLASVCNFFESRTVQELREKMTTVRLEKVGGMTLAIVTNQQIAVVERVGTASEGEVGVMHLVLDPVLIQQCRAEAYLDGVLTINTIPEIVTATAQTSSGWMFQGNPCYWWDSTVLDEWRTWVPDQPAICSEKIMNWNLHHVHALLEASPTGDVIFPEHIHAERPVVLRDTANPDWVGLFVPKPQGVSQDKGATLPEWWVS